MDPPPGVWGPKEGNLGGLVEWRQLRQPTATDEANKCQCLLVEKLAVCCGVYAHV